MKLSKAKSILKNHTIIELFGGKKKENSCCCYCNEGYHYEFAALIDDNKYVYVRYWSGCLTYSSEYTMLYFDNFNKLVKYLKDDDLLKCFPKSNVALSNIMKDICLLDKDDLQKLKSHLNI